MKAGNFNINDYLNRLYEEAEEKEEKEKEEAEEKEVSSKAAPKKASKAPKEGNGGFMDGGEDVTNSDGIVIPNDNKKSYDWLKKEFQKGKVEVKVEMNIGGSKFEPGFDLQTDLDSVKDFKPGMFGEVKTKKAEGVAKPETGNAPKVAGGDNVGDKQPKQSLDPKKDKPTFGNKEGEKEKKELPKTNDKKEDIKDKGKEKGETEEKEEKGEKPEVKKPGEKPEVKKIDLKTKKK